MNQQQNTNTQKVDKPKPPPNPIDTQKITEKIRQSIKDENFTALFNEYQQKYAKLTQTIQLTFECSISQQPIVYAVQLAECVKKGNHFENYMDLEQLIVQKQKEIEGKQFKCPICKVETKFHQIENAFVPHILVNEQRKKCGPIPKTLIYKFKEQISYPVHQGKLGQLSNKYFNEIVTYFTQPKFIQGQFREKAKKQVNFDFLFYNTCILNYIKVLIPVRTTSCQHFEAFDLVSALSKLEEGKETICRHQNCNQIITKNNIYIDFDLFESGLKSYSFSFAFQYEHAQNQLFDILEREVDRNLTTYKKINSFDEYLKYQKPIYKQVDSIYNNWQYNQNQTENFYKNNVFTKLEQEKINLMNCNYTQQRIEIPCRCIRCQGFQVCDLRFMATILHQFQNPNEDNLVKKRVECPLCDQPFIKKIKPKDLPLFEQVYIDVKLMYYLNQTQDFANINEQNIKSYIKNDKYQAKVIVKQSDESLLSSKRGIFTFQTQCVFSNSQIKRPVRGNKCTHIQTFDFKLIDMHYDEQCDLSDMYCPICNERQDYFYEDLLLKQHLSIFYMENQYCPTISIMIGAKGIQLKLKQV